MSLKKSRPPKSKPRAPAAKTRPPSAASRAVASAKADVYPETPDSFNPADGIIAEDAAALQPSRLAWSDDARGLFLYHGDCLEVMDTIAAKHPAGVFDLIFADPPYFLSNGGITCHAGKMVKVDKGGWDKSRGPALNHEFNTAWLERCQRLLKPHGSLFVSGTHHVIFSIGYAMQQLGMKLLNQITWQKPNPPPHLACRYFTHSTETVLWAAKNEKSKHRFNYADMKRANGGKQMKDVWTFTAPGKVEKILGKHPTQKPLVLLERILLAASNPGDFVLDPFMGSGTTALACTRLGRKCVGVEMEPRWLNLAEARLGVGWGGGGSAMPMVMPFEAAWKKLVAERVDTKSDLVVLTKADIESVTGNELRLMAKMDSRADVPAALKQHGYFLLPIKNGEYVLVRENGFHSLEQLPEPPSIFRPTLDFDLVTLSVGDSEMQHLDYCYNVGLFENFAGVRGLRQTIRGRKRMPAIEFSIGGIGPVRVQPGVQVEVDSGCEGRDDIVLIEAKGSRPADFIVRQLFYPYRKWKIEIPQKKVRPWFFCSREVSGRRLYEFWEYFFADDAQYQSLTLKRGEAFFIEPSCARLTVDDLLRAHTAARGVQRVWDVPQADSFWRVAELPLLVAQGIDSSAAVAAHYAFDPRQSSYYRQAAEFLGLVSLDKKAHRYELTDLGREYVSRPADERRQLLAGLLAHFTPMRAVLELSAKAGERGVGRQEIVQLIERNASISHSTPGRRAVTLLAWLKWLQTATGAVEEKDQRYSLAS